jgi:ABC-type polysaccharide/polyol phosphate transport system ATPase subunit
MGLTLREIDTQLDHLLAFAELERFVEVPLKFYSSGMAARLGYSIAFNAVREILLIDEIFAVGDAAFVQRCRERFRQLHAAGRTVILVSHDPLTVIEFCQRALLIEDGRVLMDGPPPAVAQAYLQLLGGATAPAEKAAM